MEKFGMNFGGGPSKRDLLEALEGQKQQLAQYQARLQDVVRAYKSLRQEKEALEASVKALSASPPGGAEAQLATLTSALATVTQEKARMEASYQASRKAARQEREEERSRLQAELTAAQGQRADLKARLAAQQRDRAQEQSDHALMLQELQQLVQGERAERVGLASRLEGSERQAEALKRELQAMQEERHRPDPLLQDLQKEMASLKSQCQMQLVQERRKVSPSCRGATPSLEGFRSGSSGRRETAVCPEEGAPKRRLWVSPKSGHGFAHDSESEVPRPDTPPSSLDEGAVSSWVRVLGAPGRPWPLCSSLACRNKPRLLLM